MPDNRLLIMARDAEAMAEFCRDMQGKLRSLDVTVESEVGKFLPAHKGNTPDMLRDNYRGWCDTLVESLPYMDTVIRRCLEQGEEWRTEYNRQVAFESSHQPA